MKASAETGRYGLLLCDTEPFWSTLKSDTIDAAEKLLAGCTGKPDELRKLVPFLDAVGQIREADLEALRTLALELRANADDLVIVGTTALTDQARLHELFAASAPEGLRLHVPSGRGWEKWLLPRLGRPALLVLGYDPDDAGWAATVPPALEWFRSVYSGEEFSRRVCGVSKHALAALLKCDLRVIPAGPKAFSAPAFSSFSLLPLFLAGFEASSLLEGARSQCRALEKHWNLQNPLLRIAAVRQLLGVNEGWGETVSVPDPFCQPLGLWCQHILESSVAGLDAPLPYPFPHLQVASRDLHPGARNDSYELAVDYELEEPQRLTRPRIWIGMPRLDMYTLGGLLAFFSTLSGITLRWSGLEPPPLEADL